MQRQVESIVRSVPLPPRPSRSPSRLLARHLQSTAALSMKLLLCSALLCCSAEAAWVQNPAVRFSGGATVPRAAVVATATEADCSLAS